MWRYRHARKPYQCILCGLTITEREAYVRPSHLGLEEVISRGVTWGQKRPYFHTDCFLVLSRWSRDTRVVNHKRQEVDLAAS